MMWDEELTGHVESQLDLHKKNAHEIQSIQEVERLAAAHRRALIFLDARWRELKAEHRRNRAAAA